jgi:hypothetical protein
VSNRIFQADAYKPDFGILYPVYSEEELDAMSDAEMQQRVEAKMLCEQNAKIDPMEFGWILPSWQEFFDNWQSYKVHVVLGGNRSSKSTLMARTVVDVLQKIPEARIRCWHVNDARSIEQQQQIWDALPERYKSMGRKKGTNYSVQFSQKNGFTNGKLILPPLPGCKRGGECIFMNYQSYRNDAQVAEGWWAHLIWLDEEAPEKLVETMRPRLIDATGRMVLTFTTLNGWTPLVSRLLSRTKTLRTIPARLLNRANKAIPVAQESLSEPNCRIYYFHSEDTPFLPPGAVEADMKGKPDEYILARAYGIPTRTSTSPIPGFDDMVHVVKHEDLPWNRIIKDKAGRVLPPARVTRYHVVDPSGRKPWFMIWAAFTADDTAYVYDEWPDVPTYDIWADFGSDEKGKAGPAQRALGWGYQDYIDCIAEREEGVEIEARIMDSRLGNTPKQTADGAATMISELADLGMDFVPAPGLQEDHGLQLINDRLSYDAAQPITAMNRPRLYILDRCENMIFALKNYTGMGGKDENTKDAIDCLRYLLESGCDYVPSGGTQSTGRTFSY